MKLTLRGEGRLTKTIIFQPLTLISFSHEVTRRYTSCVRAWIAKRCPALHTKKEQHRVMMCGILDRTDREAPSTARPTSTQTRPFRRRRPGRSDQMAQRASSLLHRHQQDRASGSCLGDQIEQAARLGTTSLSRPPSPRATLGGPGSSRAMPGTPGWCSIQTTSPPDSTGTGDPAARPGIIQKS
jgi:hypothetical protein